MGTPSDFEIILGDDIVELVKNECQTLAEADSALAAIMPLSNAQQLPTPPSSPVPSEQPALLHPQYQSLRWPKRLKLPLSTLVSAFSGSHSPHASLETLPCDILWTILTQPSTTAHRTLLDQDDHVSLILTSKMMAINYLEAHSRPTTILRYRELLIFDRLATPAPRRISDPLSLKRTFESRAGNPDEVFQGHQPPDKAQLKRPRDKDDTDVRAKDDQNEENACGKRRKLVNLTTQ